MAFILLLIQIDFNMMFFILFSASLRFLWIPLSSDLQLRITLTGTLFLNTSHHRMLIWILTNKIALAPMNKSTEHICAVTSFLLFWSLFITFYCFFLFRFNALTLRLKWRIRLFILKFRMCDAINTLVELLMIWIWILSTHRFIFIVLDWFTFIGK